MPSVSIPAAITSIGASLGIGGAAVGGEAALVAGGTAAAIGGIETASIPLAASFVPGGIAAAAAAGGAGTILGSTLGATALTTAGGVGLTKLLNPTPKIPTANQQTPVMPAPNDGTVLNQQRQLAAQQSAQRLGRQSTILQSPGAGDYSSASF